MKIYCKIDQYDVYLARFKISGDLISEILTCPPEINGLSINYLAQNKLNQDL